MIWNTTTTIITIAVAGTVVTVSVVLAIWLYCRRRKRLAPPSMTSKVQYRKLQKQRGSKSLHAKHLSHTTTATSSSSRKSSVSLAVPKVSQHPLYNAVARGYQHQTHTEYRSHVPHLQRNPSATSEYSFRPEHLAKGAFRSSGPPLSIPQLVLSHPAVSPKLADRPSTSERQGSATDLNRALSTRVANYHTNAEYSSLIGQDLVELLGDEPLPPPSIPRKSSRRGSNPNRSDIVGSARVVSEVIQGYEKTPMLTEGEQSSRPTGRFRTDSWYAYGPSSQS